MAKNIIINGSTYQNVPYVEVPLAQGEGKALFVDTDSGTAVAGDLRNGVKAWVDGQEVTGTQPERSATDVKVSGKTVTIPAGIYDNQATKSVANGAVTPQAQLVSEVVGDTQSDYPVVVTPKAQVRTPGYVSVIEDGAAVTKYVQVETKNVTPTTATQQISPSAGKLIGGIVVGAVDMSGTATEADVMAGKTFRSGGSMQLKTGSATVPVITQNPTTNALTIS